MNEQLMLPFYWLGEWGNIADRYTTLKHTTPNPVAAAAHLMYIYCHDSMYDAYKGNQEKLPSIVKHSKVIVEGLEGLVRDQKHTN